MPAWLAFAISAYLLMALSQTIDKALLNVVFRNSRAYACLVGCLGVLAFLLFPWSTGALTPAIFVWTLLAGILFLTALVPFLSSLQGDQASRIIPLVGALVPLLTWGIESSFLHLTLTRQQLFGVILLVTGAVVLTLSRTSSRRSWTAIGQAALAAFLFAASFVLSKYIYQQADFITAFMWMRLGGLFVSVWLLFDAAVRGELLRLWREQRSLLLGGYLGNQLVSGFGFLLQSYAISVGTATLVTAVQGVQYAVLILLVLVASRIKPELLAETMNNRMMLEKLTAVAIVAAGLYLFAL